MKNTTIEGSESGSTPKRRSPASQWSAAVVALSASINISGIIDGPIKVRTPPAETLENPPKNEEQNPKGSDSPDNKQIYVIKTREKKVLSLSLHY